ncbi:16S rRNA (cytidine(1402)-2'-O)-methyltransferase [Leptolyngbyaceae cyanobacterium CCMR0082]|uniref:Ribosomal RNA small subunit methyltransferase I n=1 Tax=Adonisia turfae CCMR0082 TaxID=2304604 RepID=A0A6M0S3T0_9CYAN|nr:16S rRNA (cytidine(1402)-2'-O)-methyltransferase [Adonisia turfae]MDV3351581.1 16S rRNA (cytidine(1402)-2'-O)-methyltransferase [Leptothoe sp. LEGE 181152]NEZ63147.1 16S rRNA (cytidine(1402)-2'-O)-methyltransferase [Adonisia turfae CCMR0082]
MSTAGTLYLVATPIGNLEDITFRAVRILQEADLIAAEDTRHTGKLLHHYQIETPQISYHEHNAQARIPQLIEKLQAGQTIALVSDAGMPGISDPGYELVCACTEAGIVVSPIPGPVAVVSAIAASALPSDRFTFEGFLPVKGKSRAERLTQLATEPRTMVLYESPHRLIKTLADLQTHLGGERRVTIARELTKRYEEFWRGTVVGAIEHFTVTEPRGEFTVAIAGHIHTPKPISEADLIQQLETLISQGLSPSKASRQLAQATGLSKREIYQLSLTVKPKEE